MRKTHDLSLERKAVGLIMLNQSILGRAGGISDEVFSDERNGRAWKLACSAVMAGHKTNPEALFQFHRTEVNALGGVDVLQTYRDEAQSCITEPEVVFLELHELYRWRQLSRIAAHLTQEASRQEVPPEELLSRLVTKAQSLLITGRDTTRSKKEVVREALDRALGERKVVRTGLSSLDYVLQGGVQSRRLYGIGGLFGRGKTIMLGSISDNLNMQQVPHLFMSMETDPEDIEIRSCAKHFNANASMLLDKHSNEYESLVASANQYINEVDDYTWYEYCPGATMNAIHRMILRAKTRHNIQGFMLDYWQLIQGRERGQSEEGHHRDNINKIAAICRQEDLWGIVTAQVDEKGKLRYSDAMLNAAALYIRMMRDEDGFDVHLEVQKTNYTPYNSTVQQGLPSLVFDTDAGPHMRDTDPVDAPAVASMDASQKSAERIYL